MMGPWSESAKIREIHILRNQKSRIPLHRFPDLRILTTEEGLRVQCVDIVTQASRMPARRNGRFSSSLIFIESVARQVLAGLPQPRLRQKRSRLEYLPA